MLVRHSRDALVTDRLLLLITNTNACCRIKIQVQCGWPCRWQRLRVVDGLYAVRRTRNVAAIHLLCAQRNQLFIYNFNAVVLRVGIRSVTTFGLRLLSAADANNVRSGVEWSFSAFSWALLSIMPASMLGGSQCLQAPPVTVLQLDTGSAWRLTGSFLRRQDEFCLGGRCSCSWWPHSCDLVRSECVFLIGYGINNFLNASKRQLPLKEQKKCVWLVITQTR